VRVVGLDLSLTATGVAAADGVTVTLSGKSHAGAERLRYLRDEIVHRILVEQTVEVPDFHRDTPHLIEGPASAVDLVCIEGYSYNSRNGGERLGELGGVVRLALHENEVPWVEISPAVVKKLATGKGNSAKEEVFAAAIRRLSYKGSSLDEADALWVREAALQHFGQPTTELPAKHLEALKGIEWPEIPGLAASIASHPAGSGV
jgi:hypothetical protein